MYKLKIDVAAAANGLRGMMKRGRTIGNALKEVSNLWRSKVEQGFQNQRDPYGNAWEPLKDSTLRLRQRKGIFGSQILSETGEMAQSLEVEVSNKEIRMTMDDPAEIHQYGNPTNRMFGKGIAPIPQRKIFPIQGGQVELPADWSVEALATLGKYVKDGT